MKALDGQLDGITISNLHSYITINNLDINACDDDSNASDIEFKFKDAHHQEWDDKKKMDDAFLSNLKPIKYYKQINEDIEF